MVDNAMAPPSKNHVFALASSPMRCLLCAKLQIQDTYVISPLKSTARCISRAPAKRDDGKNPESADAVLIGDDEGCVTLMYIDVKDLNKIGGDARPSNRQEQRVIYVDQNNLAVYV